LVVNFAILSAYISWLAIWYAGLRKLADRPVPKAEVADEGSAKKKVPKSDTYGESRGITMNHVNVCLAIIVVFFFVIFPNIPQAKTVASQARYAPTDAWQASLLWMKDNTPDPLGQPDDYGKLYDRNYEYPNSAYGVTSWWDYGYWISRIAHRIPSANPSQAAEPITKVAQLCLSQEESRAKEIMKELESSYLIADYTMVTNKFWAIITWSGQKQDDFVDIYHLLYEGNLVPIQVFYPGYYQSTVVRLYNFNGEAVTEATPMVLSYVNKVDRKGKHYKQIKDIEEFSSYQEAEDFVESKGPATHRIVGINPFISPVSLEAVQDYKLIYSSESGISHPDAGKISEVKIFEYIGEMEAHS
jgi:asparagine N-glycosylation enzyme membrane subunit Stt3